MTLPANEVSPSISKTSEVLVRNRTVVYRGVLRSIHEFEEALQGGNDVDQDSLIRTHSEGIRRVLSGRINCVEVL